MLKSKDLVKVEKVIKSCKTLDQLKVAILMTLHFQKMYPELYTEAELLVNCIDFKMEELGVY